MSKEELTPLKVGDLQKICKEKGLKISTHEKKLNKQELIEAIIGSEKQIANEDQNTGTKIKEEYIVNAEIGALVAFKLPTGKVKSAKIERKSAKRRMLKVITEYKAEYVISYDDVLWVRTNNRWPKGVYRLLKGLPENEDQPRS